MNGKLLAIAPAQRRTQAGSLHYLGVHAGVDTSVPAVASEFPANGLKAAAKVTRHGALGLSSKA